jgi:hypothetical protein
LLAAVGNDKTVPLDRPAGQFRFVVVNYLLLSLLVLTLIAYYLGVSAGLDGFVK